jgi:hypothetical protein
LYDKASVPAKICHFEEMFDLRKPALRTVDCSDVLRQKQVVIHLTTSPMPFQPSKSDARLGLSPPPNPHQPKLFTIQSILSRDLSKRDFGVCGTPTFAFEPYHHKDHDGWEAFRSKRDCLDVILPSRLKRFDGTFSRVLLTCAENSSPEAALPCNTMALRLAASTTDLPRNLSIKTAMPLPEISRGFAASGFSGVAGVAPVHASEVGERRPQSDPAWQVGEDDAFWEEGTVMELSSYGDDCSTPQPGQCRNK